MATFPLWFGVGQFTRLSQNNPQHFAFQHHKILRRSHSSKQIGAHVALAHASSSLTTQQQYFSQIVRFARIASPYVEGHRGKTFVVHVPGEVLQQKDMMDAVLDDLLLLQGMGVKLLVVVGCKPQMDAMLQQRNLPSTFINGYRVTDQAAMQAVLDACSLNVTAVQARLSKAPSMEMVRRHARSNARFSFRPTVGIVAGNYVTARRRGVVGGADLGSTGKVRYVQVEAIQEQLMDGNVVVMGSTGYSATGEVLNCNSVDVATQVAVQLQADKLVFLTGEAVADLELPFWLPVADAESVLTELYCQAKGIDDEGVCLAVAPIIDLRTAAPVKPLTSNGTALAFPAASGPSSGPSFNAATPMATGSDGEDGGTEAAVVTYDVDDWESTLGMPNEVVAAVAACRQGVTRVHLVDARHDGSLLIELFSRDGFGTMVSQDLYSGIRLATHRDLPAVTELFSLLTRAGVKVPDVDEGTVREITVMETEGQVAACAWVRLVGMGPDTVQCGQLLAFIVHPAFRNRGRGDSLLDWVEQRAREQGMRRLVLLCSSAVGAWFAQRSFSPLNSKQVAELLPQRLRQQVQASKQLQTYYKPIFELDKESAAPPGKRIGY